MRGPGLIVVWLLGLGAMSRADDWPQQGGTPDRAGASAERAGPPVAGPLWDVPLGDRLVVAPVVADGQVVLCAEDGTVRALDERTGAVRWVVDLDPVGAVPACGPGRLVVASGAGRVTCLALEDGAVQWDRPGEGGGSKAALAVSDDVVLVNHGFPSRALEALDLRTGARRWGATVAQVAYSAPCVAGGLVVTGADDGSYEARDLASGGFVWRYSTTGAVLLGGPTAGGGRLFLAPGGDDDQVHVIDPDASRWGTNLTVALVDPSAPSGWQLLGTTVSPSPLAWTGRDAVLVVRFDHVLDLDPPWGTADTWESHERVVAIDPAGAVRWSFPLASLTAKASHELPPFQRCPPPVVVTSASGAASIGFASSLEARLDWRDEAGAVGPSYALPGARWADLFAPAVANGRVVLATTDGRVLALPLAGNAAPDAPTITTPSGTTFTDAGALAWSAGADPQDPASALVHTVRLDDDGEVLLDWAFELTPPAGSATLPLPALASERVYTARVRTRDPQGASSPWSAPSTLRLSTPVEAVRALSVVRTGPTTARAEWQPSPTASVARHLVSLRPVTGTTAGAWSSPLDVGSALLADLNGLGDAATYEVRVVAVSGLGRESPPATASVDGQPPITIGSGASASTFYALGPALAAARAGDVVLLGAGTFRDAGPLTLASGVTLRGAGPGRTRIAGTGSGDVLRLLAGPPSGASARLERLTVFAGDRGVVVDAGADVVLEQLVVRDAGDGLTLAPGARAVARNLTLLDCRSRGVLVPAGATLELSSALVLDCAVGLEAGGAVSTAYSSIAGRALARLGHAPSPTDRVLTPRFVDRAAFDLREAVGSPTIDAGDPTTAIGDEPAPNGGRVNLGAFGGTDEATPSPALAQGGSSGGGGGGCALTGRGDGRPGLPGLLLLGALLVLRRRRR